MLPRTPPTQEPTQYYLINSSKLALKQSLRLSSPTDQAIDHGQVVTNIQRVCSPQILPPLRKHFGDLLLNEFTGRQPHYPINRHSIAITLRRVLRRTAEVTVPVKRMTCGSGITDIGIDRILLVRPPWADWRGTVVNM